MTNPDTGRCRVVRRAPHPVHTSIRTFRRPAHIAGPVRHRDGAESKVFTRENIFDQKGQVDSMIGRKPDLSNAAAVAGGDMGGNVRAALRLFFDSRGNKVMYRHMPLRPFPLEGLILSIYFFR